MVVIRRRVQVQVGRLGFVLSEAGASGIGCGCQAVRLVVPTRPGGAFGRHRRWVTIPRRLGRDGHDLAVVGAAPVELFVVGRLAAGDGDRGVRRGWPPVRPSATSVPDRAKPARRAPSSCCGRAMCRSTAAWRKGRDCPAARRSCRCPRCSRRP